MYFSLSLTHYICIHLFLWMKNVYYDSTRRMQCKVKSPRTNDERFTSIISLAEALTNRASERWEEIACNCVFFVWFSAIAHIIAQQKKEEIIMMASMSFNCTSPHTYENWHVHIFILSTAVCVCDYLLWCYTALQLCIYFIII